MKKTDIFIIVIGGILIVSAALMSFFKKDDDVITVTYNSSVTETQPEIVTTICKNTEITKANAYSAVTEAITEKEVPLHININTADSSELIKLEGIGEVRAEAIIEFRNLHGEFRNIEEIMLVDGIGQGIFDEICSYIYVENPVYEIVTEPPAVTEAETTEITEITENVTENVTENKVLANGEKLDINTATFEEFMQIPCMTEEHAELIIAQRSVIGGYSHVYELLYIEEIPQKTVAEYIKFLEIVK